MSIENDTDDRAEALFEAAMAQEAERPDLAPPVEDDDGLTPGEMLEATVESAKAERAAGGAEPEKPAAAERVEFKAEDYLAQRDRVKELEAKLAQVNKSSKADQTPESKAGLFEDPEGWEAQQKAAREQIRDELRAEFRAELVGTELEAMQSRLGEERYKAIDQAITEQAARDPAFAEALKKLPARGFGKTLEAWYDKNEPLLNPTAYEARLREKWEAERSAADAPNGRPAGQKPATGASAAGENVVVLPKSLSRQASSRAATDDGDGDDSEAAIFAAGANTRRA